METQSPGTSFPLRVEQIVSVTRREWRCGDTLPPRLCENWQLVYVHSGVIEETSDRRRVTLRRGWLLFHQPGETLAMRAAGEIPPEVLRVDFVCTGAAMDAFRAQALRVTAGERAGLQHMADAARELFLQPEDAAAPVLLRPDPPFGAGQQLCCLLELLLIAMARRLAAGAPPTVRARRERGQMQLFEAVRLYFLHNISAPLTVDAVCRANGCTRAQLQKAFRARTKSGAMEYLAALKLERARELLATGCSPGETAERLGYRTGAYFSRCFKKASGMTPRAYQAECFRNERIRHTQR